LQGGGEKEKWDLILMEGGGGLRTGRTREGGDRVQEGGFFRGMGKIKKAHFGPFPRKGLFGKALSQKEGKRRSMHKRKKEEKGRKKWEYQDRLRDA